MQGPESSMGFDFEFWIKIGDILDESDIVMDAMKRIKHMPREEHTQGLEQVEIDFVFDTVEYES